MKYGTLILLGLLIVCAAGYGCNRDDDLQQQLWGEFVAAHHCKVVPTPWYAANLWQCDGFQIEHF